MESPALAAWNHSCAPPDHDTPQQLPWTTAGAVELTGGSRLSPSTRRVDPLVAVAGSEYRPALPAASTARTT